MQLIERAIRTAGRGLPSSHALTALVGSNCAPTRSYGFQFSNDNPDWFRVVAADNLDDAGATYAGGSGADVRFWSQRAQRWQPGDLFFVVPDQTQPPSACALACARPYEVTGGAPGVVQIEHGGGSCYNPAPGADGCLAGSGRPNGCAGPGSRLRHFAGGDTVYRVVTSANQTKLTMRTAPFGTPLDDPAYKWIPLADGIEDMQLAVVLADGTVCDGAKSDPAVCNFGNAAAVRVTLVGRSSDVRRAVTTTIQLRSYAP